MLADILRSTGRFYLMILRSGPGSGLVQVFIFNKHAICELYMHNDMFKVKAVTEINDIFCNVVHS